ncbi:ribonuclease J [Mycoplasmopsis ciconiae]|uniref:Ribonuclease J n=1 Tax=Mycoplasmopsis ciconiae TaxID=561067 RepID=A0ABU7MLD1_9BACT|nr:ribonuclease J [Mycoplasmopsis ciconiae]
MPHINIFALGGLDENGKNCYVLRSDDDIFVINSGAKVPISSYNGVDTLIPDFNYLINNKDKIKGIFVTDVKNDSFSALPWLIMQIPGITIYTSPFNKIMIASRLQKYQIEPNSFKIETITKKITIGQTQIQPILVAGSLPGSLGFDFIVDSKTSVVFMFNYVKGDLGIYGNTDYSLIKNSLEDRDLLALVSDAGHANYSGYAIDRIQLPPSVKEAFLNTAADKRIIVGAYDEEMVAIHQILELARITNRPVVAYGKTYAQLIYLIQKIKTNLPLPQIFKHKNLNQHPNAVILVTGSVERLYSRFLRITDNKDVLLKLKNTDTVLMIAPPINGLESLAALTLDDIARIAPNIIEVTNSEYYSHRPAREDILDLLRVLKPKYFLPVQGLYRYLVDISNNANEQKSLNKTTPIILQNGKIAHFIDNKLASTNGKIKEIGDVIVDGFGIGDISSEVIYERETLGREGLVTLSFLFNPKTKEISQDFKIHFVGIAPASVCSELKAVIHETITQVLENEEFAGLKDLQERLRRVVRKKIFKAQDKEPMVVITFNTI